MLAAHDAEHSARGAVAVEELVAAVRSVEARLSALMPQPARSWAARLGLPSRDRRKEYLSKFRVNAVR